MSIQATRNDRYLTLTLSGEIGHDDAQQFLECAKANITSDIDLVKIDMSGLKYIASTGLGVLVGIRLICKNVNAEIVICNPSPAALDALHLNSLDMIFEIQQDA